MTKIDRPIHRTKKTGRPSAGVERLAEDFGFDQMERQLRRQMKALDRAENKERKIMEIASTTYFVPDIETDSFRVAMASLAKMWGGPLLKQQALWLITQEEKNTAIPTHMRPGATNQAAVEKWLRNPLGSSYWAAMSPRKKNGK